MDKEIVEALNLHFGISRKAGLAPATGGFLTENKIVDDPESSKKYFLKQHREKTADFIDYVESAERFFNDGGIPVIMPIATKEGAGHFILALEGGKDALFTLYPFVTGIQHHRDSMPDEAASALAQNLARMHLLSKNGVPEKVKRELADYWSAEKFFRKTEKVRAVITKKKEEGKEEPFDAIVFDFLAMKEKAVRANTIAYESLGLTNDTVTHGDYHEGNVFFEVGPGKDGTDADRVKVSHVFDFEKSLTAPRATELVRSVMYTFFNIDFSERSFERTKAYLDAYKKLYPIDSTQIRAALQAHFLKLVHSTWVEGEHYLFNNNRTDIFLPKYIMEFKYMQENMEKLCVSFGA